MNNLYSLTPMTGREASAHRTVVIQGVEMNFRVWMILLCSFPIAVMATAVAWAFVGQYAAILLFIVPGIAVFLIHRRSTEGLELRTYQAIWDKKTANLDTFLLCWKQIDVRTDDFRTLTANTAPVNRPTSDLEQRLSALDPFDVAATDAGADILDPLFGGTQ